MAWGFWEDEIRSFPLLALGAGSALWVARREGEGERASLRLLFAHDWPRSSAGRADAGHGGAACVSSPPLKPLWEAITGGVGGERPWRDRGERTSSPGGADVRLRDGPRVTLWVEPLRGDGAAAGAFALAFDATPPWDEAVRLWGRRFAARVSALLDALPPWPEPLLLPPAATQPTLFALPPIATAARPAPRGALAGGLPLPRPLCVRGVPGAVGVSAEFLACCETALAVAAADVNVLLHGESGTGKEILARAIHLASLRRDRPFLGENCAALPEGLLESELFGHRAGAFTGAAHEKAGLLEAASGGTFFLDEIGDMPLALQIKLLRVMQERRVRRVGELECRPVNLRWVAATHKDLAAEIDAGRFRLDLYYRLQVVRLTIPPLRRRPEDVPHLLAYFLHRHGGGAPVRRIREDALHALQAWRWPGNARELENEAQRLLALHRGESVIRFEHLSPEVRGAGRGATGADDLGLLRPLDEASTLLERYLIRKAVDACAGRKAAAARRLGLSRQGLYRKIRRHGLTDLLPGVGEPEEAETGEAAAEEPASALADAGSPGQG